MGDTMIAWLRRLGYWLRGRRAGQDLEEELQFHRDMAERDLLQSGAGRRACRATGDGQHAAGA